MRHFAQYDENGTLLAIGIGYDGEEITEEEYNALMVKIQTKVQLTRQLYVGDITIEDIPEEWREEIQNEVNLIKKINS